LEHANIAFDLDTHLAEQAVTAIRDTLERLGLRYNEDSKKREDKCHETDKTELTLIINRNRQLNTLMSAVPEPIHFQRGRREKRGIITAIAIGIMAILATSAAAAHMASSSYGSYDKVELREMEDKVNVIKSATINGLETIKEQFELNEKRHFTTLHALHEVQASIKQREKSLWYYHWVNLAISSAKRHVTNIEDIINAAAKGNEHIALLDNRNLTAVWDNMSSYAATMGLTPMTTHYIDLLNYDTNFIRRKMDEGNIDITVYVSVPLTGPDAVLQVYLFTGMPFPVKPVFFVHIKSEFHYIAISKGDVKFWAMTLNDFLRCKRVGDSYFCKDGNVVRDVPNYSKPPKDTDPIER
jgi:hypothetical protein